MSENALNEIVLRLYPANKIDSNGCWDIVPPNWSCPVCKRSKLHIVRPVRNNTILQAHLHNHHDHIEQYANDKVKQIKFKTNDLDDITYIQWQFVKNKIIIFLNRFEKILICQDCNNADTHGKDLCTNICKYFSFSPREISSFIEPEPFRPHIINQEKLAKTYSAIGDIHEYRKSLCDVLISRSII